MTPPLTSHWYRSWGPGETRRLHWYVLPPRSMWALVEKTQKLIARPEITPIPPQWLHATVIGLRCDEPGSAERQAILECGAAALEDVPRFVTSPGRPAVWGEAVVYDLSPSPEMALVHERLATAMQRYLPAAAKRVFTPHISVCYAHAEGPGEPTAALLDDGDRQLPPFEVGSVYLLDVLREPAPAAGWYSWSVVGEVPLPG